MWYVGRMHELSIALALIDAAGEELGRLGASRIVALHVRVGPLSGVVSDALRFSFDLAAAGTPVEGARLQVEETAATAWCQDCGGERELVSAARRRCRSCDAPMAHLMSGDEIELVAVEVADR